MARRRTQFLLIGLAVLAAISLWRTVSGEGERARTAKANAQLKQTVTQLEADQATLAQELGAARQTIEQHVAHLSGLRTELQSAQADFKETITELASLKRDYDEMQEHTSSLTDQLASVMSEKQQLEAKLSSIKELKLAIHEARRNIWNQRWAAWRVRLHAHRLAHADEDRLAWGNRGYVIQDGASTLGSSPRMLVHVLEPQAQ